MRALRASGYCVAEWLPQMAMLVTTCTGTPAFFASWVFARFSSRRVMANQRSAGRSGALRRAIRQLVLHGLPTTRMRTSCAAWSWIALPCGPKIFPFTDSRSPRSMPCLRGTEPTSSAHDVLSKAVFSSLVNSMPASRGNAQSSSSMATPSSDFSAGSISSMRNTTGWSGPSRTAPPAHGPAALEDLERLQQAEPAHLAEAVEEALHLADVGAVGEDDAARAQRQLGGRHRLPRLGDVQQDAVHLALLDLAVDVAELQGQGRR